MKLINIAILTIILFTTTVTKGQSDLEKITKERDISNLISGEAKLIEMNALALQYYTPYFQKMNHGYNLYALPFNVPENKLFAIVILDNNKNWSIEQIYNESGQSIKNKLELSWVKKSKTHTIYNWTSSTEFKEVNNIRYTIYSNSYSSAYKKYKYHSGKFYLSFLFGDEEVKEYEKNAYWIQLGFYLFDSEEELNTFKTYIKNLNTN